MIVSLIRRLERFGPLPDEDEAALAKIGLEARTVAAQTDLVREGDAPQGVFLVLQGFACRALARHDLFLFGQRGRIMR